VNPDRPLIVWPPAELPLPADQERRLLPDDTLWRADTVAQRPRAWGSLSPSGRMCQPIGSWSSALPTEVDCLSENKGAKQGFCQVFGTDRQTEGRPCHFPSPLSLTPQTCPISTASDNGLVCELTACVIDTGRADAVHE